MFQKIRELSKDLAIYGVGDVAVSVVNFLLLPLYVRYLTPGDYGVLGVLGSVEVVAKVFFRWGLDGSFMRLFYECDTAAARQRLASTIFLFLLAVNGALLAASLAIAPGLAGRLFGGEQYLLTLQLTLVHTFVIGFTFFPFHLLRMEKRSVTFRVLTLSRSIATLLLRLALVVFLGYGVLGIVVADLVVTGILMAVLLRWFVPILRPVFSRSVLREALHFGLPRVPHAAAQQVIAVGDKFMLAALVPLGQVGIYSMGVSFGLTQKLFLSAFEYAWAPFYYANSADAQGKRLFSAVTTYGVAVLVLLTAGLAAIGRDLVVAVVGEAYESAGPVVAWTAVGVLFQGIYLLTSIGLNITKRTAYYPVATVAAAASERRVEPAAHPEVRLRGGGLGERRVVRRAGGDCRRTSRSASIPFPTRRCGWCGWRWRAPRHSRRPTRCRRCRRRPASWRAEARSSACSPARCGRPASSGRTN